MGKPKAKSKEAPLKVGDLVTTTYWPERSTATRMVTSVFRNPGCQSGWNATATEGHPCKTCGHPTGFAPTPALDVGWFKLVKK